MNKSDISNLVKNTKLTTLATKAELKAEPDKIMKLQAFRVQKKKQGNSLHCLVEIKGGIYL